MSRPVRVEWVSRLCLDVVDLAVGDAADRHQPAGEGVLGDPEDVLLGALDGLARLAVVERTGGQDALGGRHQPAFDRLVVDDLGVVDDVGDIGQGVDQRRQIGGAADLFEETLFGELVADRHEVGGLALFVEIDAGLEDDAVALEVELVVPELVDDVEHGAGVEQHRAEDGAFRLGVVRQPVGDEAGAGNNGAWAGAAHGSFILPQKFVMVDPPGSTITNFGKKRPGRMPGPGLMFRLAVRTTSGRRGGAASAKPGRCTGRCRFVRVGDDVRQFVDRRAVVGDPAIDDR